MRRVVLESPYAGEIERNILYARRAVRDSLYRGESPIAGHLLHTQPGILDDNDPTQRSLGIAAHLEWIAVAEAVVVYKDYGISGGMFQAIDEATRTGKIIECRLIGQNE